MKVNPCRVRAEPLSMGLIGAFRPAPGQQEEEVRSSGEMQRPRWKAGTRRKVASWWLGVGGFEGWGSRGGGGGGASAVCSACVPACWLFTLVVRWFPAV